MAGSTQPHRVKVAGLERVLFPESGHTKGDLADYYAAVAPIMLPFAAARPMGLIRCPKGTAKHCFYQKHLTAGFGPDVLPVRITEKSGETEDYISFEDVEGLLECVQMNAIEFHGWASRAPDIEAPDRMVFDLDPDVGIDFADVRQAARDIRKKLSALGLESFALLTGGKGIHVVVPLRTGHSWDAHHDFAKRFATRFAEAEPARFTATMSKAKRKGRIFIDWLRNSRGSTAIMPYSVRARPHAPVAAPVSWDELDRFKLAQAFTLEDSGRLLRRAEEPALSGWGAAEQKLPES